MGCGSTDPIKSLGGFMTDDDPQNLAGQGLLRADNYKSSVAANEYTQLLRAYLASLPDAVQAEQEFGPQFSTARLKTLNTTLSGNTETAGVSKLYLDALRKSDPESARLLDSLTNTATSELELDNQLDANQTRTVEQSSRASAAARGLGFGPGDAFNETMAKLGYGDTLRDKRRSNALTLANLRMALASKPADAALAASMSSNPNLMDSAQMFSTLNNVYGQNQQNNRATANNETQMSLKAVDSIMSMI